MHFRLRQEVLHNKINWLCCVRKSWLSSASHLTLNNTPPKPPPQISSALLCIWCLLSCFLIHWVFSFNLSATGYGNIAPRTEGGKIFCILYAIFGIPLFGFLLAGIGDQLGTIFVKSILRVEKIFRVSLFGFSYFFLLQQHCELKLQLYSFILLIFFFFYFFHFIWNSKNTGRSARLKSESRPPSSLSWLAASSLSPFLLSSSNTSRAGPPWRPSTLLWSRSPPWASETMWQVQSSSAEILVFFPPSSQD